MPRGEQHHTYGKHFCSNTGRTHFKKGFTPWNKGKKMIGISGENHWNWQGGKWIDKNQRNKRIKEYRDRTKKYLVYNRIRQFRKKGGGPLTAEIIQLVYEDNIKQFGTLTCYLCYNPIKFGKDHLEHKIPLSRGGMNKYNNLAIACQKCNCRKNNKTETEYKEALNG